jgi:hypothetical protein
MMPPINTAAMRGARAPTNGAGAASSNAPGAFGDHALAPLNFNIDLLNARRTPRMPPIDAADIPANSNNIAPSGTPNNLRTRAPNRPQVQLGALPSGGGPAMLYPAPLRTPVDSSSNSSSSGMSPRGITNTTTSSSGAGGGNVRRNMDYNINSITNDPLLPHLYTAAPGANMAGNMGAIGAGMGSNRGFSRGNMADYDGAINSTSSSNANGNSYGYNVNHFNHMPDNIYNTSTASNPTNMPVRGPPHQQVSRL